MLFKKIFCTTIIITTTVFPTTIVYNMLKAMQGTLNTQGHLLFVTSTRKEEMEDARI